MQRYLIPVFTFLACLIAAPPASATFYTQNTTPAWSIGTGAPPSNVVAPNRSVGFSGTSGRIKEIYLTIDGITHTYPDDLDILLTAPDGKRSVVVSDAGGSNDLNNTYFFVSSEQPAFAFGDESAINSTFVYSPKDFVPFAGEFDGALGAGSALFNADFDQFVGMSPEGSWTVSVLDDSLGDGGSISQVKVNITTDTNVPTTPATATETTASDNVDSTSGIPVSWASSTDNQTDDSGLKEYQWCFTPSYGSCVGATESGVTQLTSSTVSANLPAGARYYTCVRAVDKVGFTSDYQCSDGVYVKMPTVDNRIDAASTSPMTFNSSPTGASSIIPVSASADAKIESVEVVLNGLRHTFTTDLDIMLESPTGQRSVLLSDVGGAASVSAITPTIKTGGITAPNTQLTSTVYKPTDFGPDPAEFAAVTGVTAQIPADLTVFNDKNPNGNWKVYAIDDTSGDTGAMGSIRLVIKTVAPVVIPPVDNPGGGGNTPPTSPGDNNPPVTPPADVCSNIEGAQPAVPAGLVGVSGSCLVPNTISSFSLTSKSITAGQKKKLPSVKVTMPRPATVTITVAKKTSGYKSGSKCVAKKPKSTKKPKKCTRMVPAKSKATVSTKAGANTLVLPTKFWSGLGVGSYTLTASANDNGTVSNKTTTLTVKPKKK